MEIVWPDFEPILQFFRSKGDCSQESMARAKNHTGRTAKRRKSKDAGDSYQLREPSASYGEHFGAKTKI